MDQSKSQTESTRAVEAAPLEGIFAAALTPMDEDLNPDHRSFAAHCRRLLRAGCHGLGIFGTTGEANSLSLAERIAALEALIEEGIPGETLLPGTGSSAFTDVVRMSRAALDAGASGVLVLPPFYYKGVSDDGLFRFFAEVIEGVGDERLKIYLYHIPQMTSVGFGLPLIGRLLEAYPGTIAGIKDSAGDVERIESLCREFPDFDVFAGTERYLLDTLRHGGAGCISATVNVTSRLARQVYDAHQAGQDGEADTLQQSLTGLRETIEAFLPIPALKYLLGRHTEEEGWRNLRPPLVNFDDEQAQDLVSRLPESKLF